MLHDITTIQKNILSWYAKHGRKLPWRKTKDPYTIHVSEVMLQQTQVDRVVPYFHQRMKDFPDYQTLAKASKTDVLRHRSGLGFNSRALRLQKCAKKIIQSSEFRIQNGLLFRNGKLETKRSGVPQGGIKNGTYGLTDLRTQLQKLPGIGPYTSAAIMAFAWNLPVPVIDTNIRRVLIFLFKLPEIITAKALETFAEKIIPPGCSRDRHNALMDQGALLLTARKTKIKPLSKQSKFEGSDRQVRGRTMKQLTKSFSLDKGSERDLLTIKKVEEEFPHKDVKNIIKGLQKESLIKVSKGVISIAE